MSEETPSVEEIKARLKVEVPVEEDETVLKAAEEKANVSGELRDLGRRFAETLQTAWNSEERQRAEAEIREGLRSFADEVDRVFGDIKQSETAGKVRTEATQLRDKVQESDVSRKTRSGVVQGLRWLSEELGNLANKFTPVEKPADEEPVEKPAE